MKRIENTKKKYFFLEEKEREMRDYVSKSLLMLISSEEEEPFLFLFLFLLPFPSSSIVGPFGCEGSIFLFFFLHERGFGPI